MITRCRIDAHESRLMVKAFAGGLLSFMAHSPSFAVRELGGSIWLDAESLRDAGMEITAKANSLDLLDNVRAADRADIEERMRREVLEVAAHPDLHFRTAEMDIEPVADHRYRARLQGPLTVRGVSQRLALEPSLQIYPDGVRLIGEFPLTLSAYRIHPVTALGGTIRLQDQLKVSFDLVAWKEQS